MLRAGRSLKKNVGFVLFVWFGFVRWVWVWLDLNLLVGFGFVCQLWVLFGLPVCFARFRFVCWVWFCSFVRIWFCSLDFGLFFFACAFLIYGETLQHGGEHMRAERR